MVGQEAITRTLKNQIIAGRTGHAYLFNGGRGTGKTTSAKILARAVNCLNPKDGEPCNECEICKAALAGSLTDIVEMDAASNNSVDDIRSIRDEVNFLPTLAKYRVYIIDEVHMLSTGAFNALLKTLEEPPEYVIIILIVSNESKLLNTVKSRCVKIEFSKLTNEEINNYLQGCGASKLSNTLLEQWRNIAYDESADRGQLQRFWGTYFQIEKEIYEQLLTNPDEEVKGTVKELAEKYDVEMPIITEINKVLFEGKSAAEAVIDLMVRDKKVETPMLPWEDGQKTN